MNATLSISEACKVLGVSRETLRKRYLHFDMKSSPGTNHYIEGKIRAKRQLNGRVVCWAQDVEALLSTEVRNV